MKKKDIKALPTEELQADRKKMVTITSMLFGALLVLILVKIFTEEKLNFMTFVFPLCMFPILIANYVKIKEITDELKSRE